MTSISPRVLVVDDEPTVREVLSMRIGDWGFQVQTAADAEGARRSLEKSPPDIVISDLVLPESSGLQLLRQLKSGDPGRPVILITAHGSIDDAVEAMKVGATDFLTKPLDYAKLRALLDEAREEVRLRRQVRDVERRLDSDAGLGFLVGDSEPMREVYETIELLAGSDASAIITGESGTGKELVARTLHSIGARADGPFVAVNAAAIPDGLMESEIFGHEKGAFTGAHRARPGCFEQADGGTLLLDEIAEMPPALQPKLLRILEEGKARRLGGSREVSFSVRVLAATNRDTELAVEEGRLREDLFYRLNVFRVEMPPLREHPADIPLLAQHFIRIFNDKHGTSVEGLREETRGLLEAALWSGNVRELRNVLERAAIVARDGWIEPSHLPPYLRGGERAPESTLTIPVGTTAEEAEKRLILRTLEHVGNNKAEAARRLGLDPKTIRNKLKKWES